MGDESPSVMGSVQDVYEAGKAKAREALAALQSAMESLENGAEDVQEVLELYDDFSNLLECQKAIARSKGQLEDFGASDLFISDRMRELESILYNINHRVEVSNVALTNILGTSLRFSPDFMEAPILETHKGLDKLNGASVGIVEWLGRNKTSGPHPDLRLDLLNLRTNLGVMYQNLDALVNPTLTEPTNNVFLNQYLQVKEVREKVQKTVQDFQQLIHRLQQIKEAMDKIKRLTQ